jgi:hypothetical protein
LEQSSRISCPSFTTLEVEKADNAQQKTRQWMSQNRRKSMQTTMALEDIMLTLPELLDKLTPGDEVIY